MTNWKLDKSQFAKTLACLHRRHIGGHAAQAVHAIADVLAAKVLGAGRDLLCEGAEELALQLIGHAEAVAGGGAGEAAQTQALAALCALAAALLQGRLAHLTAVAEAADHTEVVGDAAHQEHLAMTAQEAAPKA